MIGSACRLEKTLGTLYFTGLQFPNNLVENFMEKICNIILIPGSLLGTFLINTFKLIASVN